MKVLIAGGGVAGLEALLALREMAGDRVGLVLVAPDAQFTYRPLAVAEPFALGHAHRVPLSQFAEDTGAELVIDAVAGVDMAAREVRLGRGGTRSFDALLLAPGGRAVAGVEGATTWWPGGDPEIYGGLLRDIEEGYAKRIAIAVPPGAVWPLPAYELALMTAGEARAMGHDDVEVTIVTPEHAALSLFGEEPSQAVSEELKWAGIKLKTGVVARREGSTVVLEPTGERLDVQRLFAVPRVVGPALDGVPRDDEGFIDRRRRRARRGRRARLGGRRRGRLADQVRRPGHAPGSPRGRRDRPAGGRRGRAGSGRAGHPRAAAGGPPQPPADGPRRHRGRAAVVAAGQGRRRLPAALADRARRHAAGRPSAGR